MLNQVSWLVMWSYRMSCDHIDRPIWRITTTSSTPCNCWRMTGNTLTVFGSGGAEVRSRHVVPDGTILLFSIVWPTISICWCCYIPVGKSGQHSLEEYGGNLTSAKASFTKKWVMLLTSNGWAVMNRFYDKTNNSWDDRNSFVKVPGKYDMVAMDYGSEVVCVCTCVCVHCCGCYGYLRSLGKRRLMLVGGRRRGWRWSPSWISEYRSDHTHIILVMWPHPPTGPYLTNM